MCNYAVNSITFSSRNSKLLKELHKKVLACYDAMSDGKNLVMDLLKAHGYIVPFRVNSTDHVSAYPQNWTRCSGNHTNYKAATTKENTLRTLAPPKNHHSVSGK